MSSAAGPISKICGAALAACLLFGLAAAAPSWGNARTPQESKTPSVPQPHQVISRSAPVKQAKTALIPFQTAPFPYRGTVPGTAGKPFLDVEQDGRRGHSTPYGRLYWEDETYSDNRVLLHIRKASTSAARPS